MGRGRGYRSRSCQVRWSPGTGCGCDLWVLEGAGGVVVKGVRHRLVPSTFPAVAMAKGRVAERSPTGALQTTPAGDRAAGTRSPTAPGSGDHLKGEWNQGPELDLAQRREFAGRGSGGERTSAGFPGFAGAEGPACSHPGEESRGPGLGPLHTTRQDI